MIQFDCLCCHKTLQVEEHLAGKTIPCPHCNDVVTIPQSAQTVAQTRDRQPNAPTPTMTGQFPEDTEQNSLSEEPGTLPPVGTADTATIPPVQPTDDVATIPPTDSPAESPTMPPKAGPEETATIPPEQPSTEKDREIAAEVPGYEILSELGGGGMGVVYKARHLQLNRVVALKMILAGGHAGSEDIVRFLSEAEAVATLQHPNVVQVFEVSHHNNLPFMALEFVEGGSLGGKLKSGPLPANEAAKLVEQMAHGMNAAHQAGIVHRDLKPDNVIMTADGTPKITDFGLAKKIEGGSGLTQTGAIMGTPSYMAPEQAFGEGKRVGPAADVYALGAILYCCLTGKPPFQANTPLDTIRQVVSEEPKPPTQINPKVPKDLETICLKCLEKEPLKRYASAEALGEDLRKYLNDEPIAARPVSRTERAVKWVKRNTALAMSMAAVFLVLILGVGISTWQAVRATKDPQKSLDEVAVSVTRGWGRPFVEKVELGEPAPVLSRPEREVLQELAQTNQEAFRIRFIQEALRSPFTTRQLRNRSDYALIAAVGLDKGRRRAVEDVLIAQFTLSDQENLDLALIATKLGGLNPTAANRAGLALSQAMTKTNNSNALYFLSQGLSSVAQYMQPKEAAETAAVLSQAMTKKTDSDALRYLSQCLSSVAQKMLPKDAAETAAVLSQAMTNTTDYRALLYLSQGMWSVDQNMVHKDEEQRRAQVS
ncbi:MAG: protein kinase, partial [Gemmataceae bacterium]